jgi:hypothetical protein
VLGGMARASQRATPRSANMAVGLLMPEAKHALQPSSSY